MIWSTSDFKGSGTGLNNCNFFHAANMITITASTASTIQILRGWSGRPEDLRSVPGSTEGQKKGSARTSLKFVFLRWRVKEAKQQKAKDNLSSYFMKCVTTSKRVRGLSPTTPSQVPKRADVSNINGSSTTCIDVSAQLFVHWSSQTTRQQAATAGNNSQRFQQVKSSSSHV